MNKKRKEPPHCNYIYLIDPVRGTYEEYSIVNMRKRINKSESFIREYMKSHELFIIDGRGYYLAEDFGDVWDLI